jgi:putative RNA 2'-phosphotransferase
MKKSLVRYSKFLSLVLRHDPGAAGLTLDRAGWADVGQLLTASAARGFPGSLEALQEVVATNDKQRFAFSPDGSKIRARQGHSIAADVGLSALPPPDVLYHGTAERFVAPILSSGIHSGTRQYVHLSVDVSTATRVGQRHGRPVVLRVDAGDMQLAGYEFFLSENGVWLTREVPSKFVSHLDPNRCTSKCPRPAGRLK